MFRFKRFPRVLLLLLIVVTFAGILYNTIMFITSKKHGPGEKVLLIIPEGASAQRIGELLEENKIIASSRRFIFHAKITGKEKSIKAGRYAFNKGMGVSEVLKQLVKGETSASSVTIPEGLRIDEVGDILERELEIDKNKFLEFSNDRKYAVRMGITGKNFEGFLYPNTYEFNYGVTEKEVLERLVREFWKVFNDSLKTRAKEIGFTVFEVVTLASMIEEESMVEEEEPIISQVYHKRLKLDRALECDATIQYALPKHKSRLLYKDLRVKSPYNTYIHKGLPIGPIANPGKSALIAALYPSNTEFLYYVAKGDGSHIFSKTAKEHNQAIAELRRNNR